MHGSWHLTVRIGKGKRKPQWRLAYVPLSLAEGCVLSISLQISPPPKLRGRSQAFQLLEDLRREYQLRWMKEVRAKDQWCKCLVELDELRKFIRPLLKDADIVRKDGEAA